ncbi:hypothetical protein K435DRAFT_792296 [Dendrothele bispora CBS 962.96]|uniref:DUF1295-domain-containing protein n=1 Tax=Dendrothele bispora (strain CBS 962.96) TaxID=1314807 RepID=A0A4S8MJD7_DENBC|nr:hypothetical protein K435DRAFT_792296 [Dendrothele bispora CBS 962.96]
MALPLTAFTWPLQFCVFTTVATYVASVITSNVSQVDRLWTFLPTIYTAYFALLPLWPRRVQPFPLCPFVPEELIFTTDLEGFNPRATLMLGVIVMWMFRLSYNTYRRGLFSLKDEDYRWAILRTQIPPWFFQIVNLTFIAGIQNFLLMLLGVPAYYAATQPRTPLTSADLGLAGLALVVLATEFTADNQQYAYQTFKYAYLAEKKGGKPAEKYDESKQWPGARLNWTPKDAERGFLTKGLWAYSRHPNFACELSFWWIITLFPLVADAPPYVPNYSFLYFLSGSQSLAISQLVDPAFELASFIRVTPMSELFTAEKLGFLLAIVESHLKPFIPLLPVISLNALFLSSTPYTEAISISKYPKAYLAYKERVAMFSPLRTIEIVVTWKLLLGGQQELKEFENLLWDKGKKD